MIFSVRGASEPRFNPIHLYMPNPAPATTTVKAPIANSAPSLWRLISPMRYSALDVERAVPMDTVPLANEPALSVWALPIDAAAPLDVG